MSAKWLTRMGSSGPFPYETGHQVTKNIRNTKTALTSSVKHVILLSEIQQTFEAKIKPEGTPTESRGQLRTRGRCAGKWIAEGKGKRGNPEYPDRWPALRAEHVLACS